MYFDQLSGVCHTLISYHERYKKPDKFSGSDRQRYFDGGFHSSSRLLHLRQTKRHFTDQKSSRRVQLPQKITERKTQKISSILWKSKQRESAVLTKYRRIGVPTQDSFSSRIIKVCSLSRVESESENWRIGVELFGVQSNNESSIEAIIESIIEC